MKKFTKLFAVALCLLLSANLSAEKIMLDLSTPANPESWSWTDKNYWAETYNEDDYDFFEAQIFALTHGGDSYYMSYWGFTVSKNASDENMTEAGWVENQWGCMAKGGIRTFEDGNPVVSPDSPYLIAYSNSWYGPTACGFIFNDGNTYMAKGMYITNHPWTYYDVTVGEESGARKLDQEGDYYKVIATGYLNGEAKATTAEINLAEFKDGALYACKDWTWFDLSALGEVDAIYFTIDGSDQGLYGLNTASYFCADRITVEEVLPTAADEAAEVKAYRISNTIYGIAEGAEVYVYNLGGQLIINQTVNGGSITLPNAAPYYITKIVTESGVQTVR